MHPASILQLSIKSSLSGLEAALDLFRELRPEMAIQLPLIFLLIAQHRSISAARLRQLTDLSQSAISRNIAALTKEGKPEEPGLGLVVKTIDPTNPRAHAIHMTKRGRALVERLAEALGKAVRVSEPTSASMGSAVPQAAATSVPGAFAAVHWEVWID